MTVYVTRRDGAVAEYDCPMFPSHRAMSARDYIYHLVPQLSMRYVVDRAVDVSYDPPEGVEAYSGIRGPADLAEWIQEAEPEDEE